MTTMVSRLRSLWRNLFRRARVEHDLDAELESSVQLLVDEKVAQGMSASEARRRALIELGGLEQIKERVRDIRSGVFVDALWQDVRYGVRSLVKAPFMSIVALSSLAIGIGVNASLFSLVDVLVTPTLPVPQPDRLKILYSNTRVAFSDSFSYPDFVLIQNSVESFDGVFAVRERRVLFNMKMDAGVIPVRGEVVTGGYFAVLGIKPAHGRLFAADDDQPAAELPVVLSDRFWAASFDRDTSAIGRAVHIDSPNDEYPGRAFRIIGISPPGFWGTAIGDAPDIFLPMQALPALNPFATLDRANSFGFHVMARLKDGVTEEQAAAELTSRFPNFDAGARNRKPGQAGIDNHVRKVHLREGQHGYSEIRTEYVYALMLLMTLVAVVLVIACANVANLLLVQVASRSREIGARLALGATPGRLLRQWVTEGLMLSTFGGILGIGVAFAASSFLLTFIPEQEHEYLRFRLGLKNLMFTGAVAVATGLAFSVVPAVWASRVPLAGAFARASGSARVNAAGWLVRTVVVIQVAVSLCLVTGAGLFTRTLLRLNAESGGFDRRELAYVYIPGLRQYPRAQSTAMFSEILERVAASPEIASAAAGGVPLEGYSGWSAVAVPGYTLRAGEATTIFNNFATPGFFHTMGIQLLAGRDFHESDRTSKQGVAIVNETFVRRFFNGRDAIGQTIRVGPRPVEIIGIVRDTPMVSFREQRREMIYHPLPPASLMSPIVARPKPGFTASDGIAAVRRATESVGKDLTVRTGEMEQLLQASLRRDRLIAQLSAGLAVIGLSLACIGLYATMAFTVSSRTAEIGVRMASGAARADIILMILKQSFGIAAIGVGVGVPLAAAAAQLVEAQLFAISPTDIPSIAVAAGIMLLVALAAGYVPAHRAARLDPVRALRYE